MAPKSLKIINARENNLKSVSLDIPHDTLTVVTGLSGSGKSSLAFDTVYAEGQRRYIETFSPYTRQFFDKVKKPDIDLIENVRPAIAIQQRTRILSSRSTVGSLTNINDYLKILWASVAKPVCPSCGINMEQWEPAKLATHLLDIHATRGKPTLLIAAPITLQGTKKKILAECSRLSTLGYGRYLDPTTGSVETWEDGALPALFEKQTLILVLDRLKGESVNKKRLTESVEQAFSLSSSIGGDPKVWIINPEEKLRPLLTVINSPSQPNIKPLPFSLMEFRQRLSCPFEGLTVDAPKPSLFSFNHPIGACPTCKGFGKVLHVDPALCVPDPRKSIKEKALQCWASDGTAYEYKKLVAFCLANEIPTTKPWHELTESQKELIFTNKTKDYRGVNHWFRALERKAYKMHVRVFLAKYRGQFTCTECNGTRLKKSALAFEVKGKKIYELWLMPISELLSWITALKESLKIEKRLTRELGDLFSALLSRLQYLFDLGLPYLTLDRQARTLSGGETQRVNLATALGSELISTHFVLDEPSVGLHARDTERLIHSMRALQQRGNSLLVVEHDLDCMNEADHIIELGPLAGEKGGEIIFSGPQEEWKGVKVNVTPSKVTPIKTQILSVKNAQVRNLKSISIDIPLGRFVSLTGVSGSGKSTLVHEVIEKAYQDHSLGVKRSETENVVQGFDAVDQILVIDQSPLARSPRGNIGTYSGIWDVVRDLLAQSDDAIARALSKSAFSFNVDGGRCPVCSGAGFIREDMQFLSDVYIPCEACLGKRFQESVLEVYYKGHNAHDFLKMSVDRVAELFGAHPTIGPIAETLCELGLGHTTLGHPLSELSGGEAQRLKLVPFIHKSARGRSLLIFDEPTTGLHQYDVEKLITLLRGLTARGHSVLCVEHNLSLIASSDWLIDLGPEGGDAGGYVVREGTPSSFIENANREPLSYTAKYLKEFFDGKKRSKSPRNPKALSKEINQKLIIRGAREHNLKNIDVEVPLNSVVAITGVSGSGKSTIAKDIIYAEGQRRYLDCLSPYARQFIKELKKPEMDEIRNVKPTICVYQHTFQPSKLSTIGTMSEIYNYLRLLYAKTGTQFCPDHPEEAISPLTAEDIAREISKIKSKSVRILAPVIKKKKGNHRAILERAVASEISQVRIDGVFLSPSSVALGGGLEKSKAHTIEFVIGKFNPSQVAEDMISDAVRQSLSLGSGTLVVHSDLGETIFSTERTCPICKRGFFKPDPEDLSFSSKRGSCPDCSGAGISESGDICKTCNGSRLNELGRNIRIDGRNIHELSLLTPSEVEKFLGKARFLSHHRKIAEPVLAELTARARALTEFGLDYIPLSRACNTLSGGELQRLRLAAAMGSPLTGVMYIFDEPTAGLHPNDIAKVTEKVRALCNRGNSVLMIEHESASIEACDYIIDVGPGGGKTGGQIVYSGPLSNFVADGTTATAVSLRETLPINTKTPDFTHSMSVSGADKNNLKDLSMVIPLGGIVTVAGVSGAGKSSLVRGTIADTILNGKGEKTKWVLGNTKIETTTEITRVVEVDQKPIGINSRSTPASYLGIWDHIRDLFAKTLEAKTRGWKNSHFSYNTGKGRCPECKGLGQIKLEMSFLPDAFVECESCRGARFTEEAQSVRYLGLNISQALNLTFEEAMITFVNHRKIYQPLRQACDLGLGYLTLGQSSTTLSGGESQRIKLVSELGSSAKGHTLYILDEPTTGLHKSDVARLIKTLKGLVALSNSVLLIEHDIDILAQSDYVIEMGPGPGEEGGRVIFAGGPAQILKAKTPWGEILSSNYATKRRSIVGQ